MSFYRYFWYLKTAILGPWKSLKSPWILSFHFAMNPAQCIGGGKALPQTLAHFRVRLAASEGGRETEMGIRKGGGWETSGRKNGTSATSIFGPGCSSQLTVALASLRCKTLPSSWHWRDLSYTKTKCMDRPTVANKMFHVRFFVNRWFRFYFTGHVWCHVFGWFSMRCQSWCTELLEFTTESIIN